jgi:peptidoglycan/xylan/chitin deacetylase (PgdA/CDA1 family)
LNVPGKPRRHRLRIALYHHIANGTSPFFDGLHVSITPAELERQLRYFQKNYDVVSLDDVLGEKLPRRPLLLTFDDAYRSVYDVAAPLLRELRMPAVFLISAGHVDGAVLMTDHVLCYLAHAIGLSCLESEITGAPPTCKTTGELIGTVISQLDYETQTHLSGELTRRHPIPTADLAGLRSLYIGHAEVARLAEYGIEVGSHTYSHVFCRHLELGDAEVEIRQARRMLEDWTSRSVRAFSIPYGNPIDLTPETYHVLESTGHHVIFSALSRQNRAGQTGPILDRINMLDCHNLGLWTWVEFFPWLRTIRPRRHP